MGMKVLQYDIVGRINLPLISSAVGIPSGRLDRFIFANLCLCFGWVEVL